MQGRTSVVTGSLALLTGLSTAMPTARMDNLVSCASPAHSYEEAVQRVLLLQAQDTPAVNPVCRTRFMTHGQQVERAIVFFHGYTNCPQQFARLGRKFYQMGYNVLIPRMPHNGLMDRLNVEHAKLNAEKCITFADEAIDIGRGLGTHLTIAGLSAGGVISAWAAQQRSDIDRAVVLAPSLGLPKLKANAPSSAATMQLSLRLPNRFVWWDKELKSDAPAPPQLYPRFSTHALAEVLRLGVVVQATAEQSKPAARSILVVTTARDVSVDNRATAELVHAWYAGGMEQLYTYEFASELGLPHDFIDPAQVDQNTELVYPILIDLITRP